MSLLSSFIAGHVVKALEQQLLAHEPDLQAAFVSEVEQFVGTLAQWVNSKLQPKVESDNG